MTTHKKVVRKRTRRTVKKVGPKTHTRKRIHRIRVRGGATAGTVHPRSENSNLNSTRKAKVRTNRNIKKNTNNNENNVNNVKLGVFYDVSNSNDISHMKVIEKEYKYPIDTSLCVLPTPLARLKDLVEQESQYEAFQSIFAHFMAADPNRKPYDLPITPYEILCREHNILLIPTKDDRASVIKLKEKQEAMGGMRIIFFNPSKTTHYKALIKGQVRDPYKYYQANKTQGFCQMFAFLLAINDDIDLTTNDIPGFKKVYQNPVVDLTEENPNYTHFNSLVINSHMCLKEGLKYIRKSKNVYKAFEREFNVLVNDPKIDKYTGLTQREHYGIKEGTEFNKYISDFEKINNDFSSVAYYIYDQPMKIVGDRQILWDEYFTQDYEEIVPNGNSAPMAEENE
jgi:hypothetical protein